MAEEQEKEPTSGGLRFRLPKLFAETVAAPSTDEADSADDADAAPPTYDAVLPQPNEAAPVTGGAGVKAKDGKKQSAASAAAPSPTTLPQASILLAQMQAMQEDIQRMHDVVIEINDRENAHEKVFNTLHTELREYKTDFIYEHFKPVVRPLLFLYDSLEQFDAEIALYERPNRGERRQEGLSPQLVRDNINFFRDQLAESLRICEVTPMETPTGPFNAKLHKVIDVVPADEEQDGIIQRVVRSGWYLNGQLLRPAEVIVGKKM